MNAYGWKWGFWIRAFGWVLRLLGPWDRPLFTERNGRRSPILRVGRWRLFFDRDKVEKQDPLGLSREFHD